MRTWRIDPACTAMENLFSAATYAAAWFKHRAIKKGLTLTGDEWAEVMDEIIFISVRRFLSKLKTGGYSHAHSFYLNVRSCVYSVFYNKVNQYIKHVVLKKMCSLDRMEPAHAQYLKESRPMPRAASKSEMMSSRQNLKAWQERHVHENFLVQEDADDFWSYVEACADYGIEPNKNAPLYKRGRNLK
jgi:hypothetical protein